MTTTSGREGGCGVPASSPCMLHEATPDGTRWTDPQQSLDVARWRKAERQRLLGTRIALSEQYRSEQTLGIGRALDQILAKVPLITVSVYWPIRAEPDLRAWMGALSGLGVRVALPVAIALGQPLVFREWHPQARLRAVFGRFPIPPTARRWSPT